MATTLSEDWVGSGTLPYLGPGCYLHGHVDGPTASDDFVLVELHHSPRGTPKAIAQSAGIVLHGGTSFTAQMIYGGNNEGNVVGTSLDIVVFVFHANFTLVSQTTFSAAALWEPTAAIATLITTAALDITTINSKLDTILAATSTSHHNAP